MSALCGFRHRAPHLSLLMRGGRLGAVAAMLICAMAVGPRAAFSQTPAPLQEWQYSAGIVLVRMFEPTLPHWRGPQRPGGGPRPPLPGARDFTPPAGAAGPPPGPRVVIP